MEDYILIGEIVKTRGLKGELKVRPLTDVIGQFESSDRLYLAVDKSMTPFDVVSAGIYKNSVYLSLQGIDSIEDAEKLIGCDIYITPEQRIPLSDDIYYFDSLQGSEVVSETGESIGKLTDVYHLPASDILVIDREGAETLIPFVEALVTKIDPERKIITVIDMPSLWNEKS